MIDLLVVHRPVGGGHRAAFERIADVRAPAAGEPLRVLVTSGGFGVGPIEKVVASFAGIEAIGRVVVCGRARGLVERVARTAREARVSARVLGFERDRAAWAGEADSQGHAAA
jgi:processive 1,2-diacylglycerol beta-glucosyltransferase